MNPTTFEVENSNISEGVCLTTKHEQQMAVEVHAAACPHVVRACGRESEEDIT